MNLFIDTNILLDFYHLSGSDIDELHKLIPHLVDKSLILYVPQQLCEEFKRNRDNKIQDAMNEFQKTKFKISFPAFCKLYPEYSELQEILKTANMKHAELYQKAISDVDAVALKADNVIAELFAKAQIIELSDDVYKNALLRFHKGNPPGKKKVTIGDEINWEALLEAVPMGDDLNFVTNDGDYSAAMDTNKINQFLDEEWSIKKKSSIIFHKSLQSFFKTSYPEIKLAGDAKKNALIEDLAKSGSFAMTHLIIGNLAQLNDFSASQVEQLIQIADMNNQVGWVIGDEDVLEFYTMLKAKFSEGVSPESLQTLNQLIPVEEQLEGNTSL